MSDNGLDNKINLFERVKALEKSIRTGNVPAAHIPNSVNATTGKMEGLQFSLFSSRNFQNFLSIAERLSSSKKI